MADGKKNVTQAIQNIERKGRRDRGNLGQHLSNTMVNNLLAEIEVAEVYSFPRITRMVEQRGLRAGWALDLTICVDDGRFWDFDQFEMGNRAVHKLLRSKPILLIGSPTCTAYNQMSNTIYYEMDPRDVERRVTYGRKHFDFLQIRTILNGVQDGISCANIKQVPNHGMKCA